MGMRTVVGDIFTIATLHTILRNPAYKGTLIFNRLTKSKWHRYIGGEQGRSTERQDEGFERRGQEDWIVVENAWPALVDAAIFDAVQAKLVQVRQQHTFATGRSVHAGYLLTGTMCCGVCGGKLIGQSKYKHRLKPSTRRKYPCGTHHKGDHAKCPTRYVVPADVVEGKVWEYIKADLSHLRGDKDLHGYIAEEMAKANGGKVEAKKALQARASDLDGQITKLTTHLSVLDVQTATTLGLYAKAKTLADERGQVRVQLAEVSQEVPDMPSAAEIARRADEALGNLDKLLESGSLEEKRELVRTYVKGIKVDPTTQTLELSVMPALFSRIVKGAKVTR